jgi:hypothetical protein
VGAYQIRWLVRSKLPESPRCFLVPEDWLGRRELHPLFTISLIIAMLALVGASPLRVSLRRRRRSPNRKPTGR